MDKLEAEKLLHSNDIVELLNAIKDENRWARRYAAEALGKFRELRIVNILIEIRKNDVPWVQSHAAKSLVKMDFLAVDPLINLLKEAKYTVRSYIINILVEIGESAMNPLIKALDHENQEIRKGATDALVKINIPSGIAVIERKKEENKVALRQLAKILNHSGDPELDPLRESLREYKEED